VSLQCDAQFSGSFQSLGAASPADPGAIEAYAGRAHAFTSCMSTVTHPKGYWMMAGVAGLALLAFVLYAATPLWKIRRDRLVPFRADDDPDVLAELHDLCRRAGLERTPAFVWDPLDRAVSGLAFGALGRNRVRLAGGLVTKRYTDPDVFAAVVLHELAHIRNRDVSRFYLTVAIWNAFLLAAVLPLVIALATGDGRTFFDVGWRLVVLTGFVYLTRNAVLRTRELYADVRADATGAVGIRRLVGADASPRDHRLRRLLRLHPSGTSRAATITDTDSLFTIGAGEAVGAGIVMALVFHELVTLLTFFHPDPDPTIWLAALGVAPLVVGIVGLEIWRAAFRATIRDMPIRGVWTAGLGLAAGALLGEALSFDQLGSVTGSRDPVAEIVRTLGGGVQSQPGIVSSAAFGSGAVWVVILVCSMVAFAWWIAAGASVWLRRGACGAPRRAAAAGYVAATVVLTVWLGVFYLSYEVVWPAHLLLRAFTQLIVDAARAGAWIGFEPFFRVVTDTSILYFASKWFVIPALAVVVCFPLAAALVYRTPRPTSSEAFLDPAEPAAPAGVALRILPAILVGVAAGAAVWLALVALRAGVHSWEGIDRRTTGGFALAFLYWMILVALAGQVIAACVGAVIAPAARVFHGALAGLIAGLIGAAALAFGKTMDSCATPLSLNAHAKGCPELVTLDVAKVLYEYVLGEGILLALGAAGLAAVAVFAAGRTAGAGRAARRAGSPDVT
jgi:Zn-dependent protease with chaperone function